MALNLTRKNNNTKDEYNLYYRWLCIYYISGVGYRQIQENSY